MNSRVVLPNSGEMFDFGGLGVHWKIDVPNSGQRFAIVHGPSPRGRWPPPFTTTARRMSIPTSYRKRSGRCWGMRW
jgi:hypothetical protein